MIPQNSNFPSTKSLKSAFEAKFRLGATLSRRVLCGEDAASEAIARQHFSAFTAENCMKPQGLQPVEGEFHWMEADRLLEIAEQSGAMAVGHTLVWHQQTPAWFFQNASGEAASREQLLARMREHIATVVGRYRGRVAQWDVLNEVISDNAGEHLRPNPWLAICGEDYIAEAFRTAHAADPGAMLIYNDYNIERGEKHQKTLRFLKKLLADGVPVQAVGIQGHWHLPTPSIEEIETAIGNFAALGLQICITELDVSVLPSRYEGADLSHREENSAALDPYTDGLPLEVGEQLAERYAQLSELFLRHQDKIERVTLWGVADGDSWLNDFPVRGRTDYPLLFDRDFAPKAAFFAVQETAQKSELVA